MLWANDYVLPELNAKRYPSVTDSSSFIDVRYSSRAVNLEDKVVINERRPVYTGQALRIRVLAPPGATGVSIGGESNLWQGSAGDISSRVRFKAYDYDPGNFIYEPTQRPAGVTNNVYASDLEPAGGGLSLSLYGKIGSKTPPLTSPRYLYFVLYNPANSVNFTFESLSFSFVIGDTNLYTAWRNKRPWAGGSGNIDGIGEEYGSSSNTRTSSVLNLPNLGLASVGGSVFFGGISSTQGGAYLQRTNHPLSSVADIQGAIQVDSQHVGQNVELLIFASYTPPNTTQRLYYMLSSQGLELWDGNPNSLKAYKQGIVLQSYHPFELYKGQFVGTGLLNVYFGYRLPNKMIITSKQSIDINVF
ncbi:hypothetical protein BegalDRAFT_2013 [Beggiatoa alba B18LD]|uniref:Uncharacterized protein n=1 Tax=Beggiatoa alba B18LD TaxID=395493 RepID=I3CGY6_9GAMM|nr:hypothetical protein [Beggiatoa alba]EIJ42879.1 hypothetical protein BegalDRAFT_2013 [Beggiatoa alba B18LD]